LKKYLVVGRKKEVSCKTVESVCCTYGVKWN